MRSIDLNCDLGEAAGHDAELMPLITSANIACGGHAGDRTTMQRIVALAREHGVTVGAHPGFADREGFGRRELTLPAAQLQDLVTEQVAALRELSPVRHVKLHGGLYHFAARDRDAARAIVDAVRTIDDQLIVFAPSGSELALAAAAAGLRVAGEVFADRTYQPNGRLTSRAARDSLITGEDAMVAQVLQMVRTGTVRASDGRDIAIGADTLCLHGDGIHAVAFARRIRAELSAAGIGVRPVFSEGRSQSGRIFHQRDR